ncbi:LEAF RUST 10 DISEASE-RESISTANCE LOCUS RECEPTOR-LIKE PROTEIN KINASE-like 2.1 isoform X2 [Oryza glaberrima]|uniref:LEAF RUST 10 DISEASE-RESISTANCE LOCUS RECEPTOR-LIKE PROTEIN KINASE-like 2.1 isoform X2 n=1 Tax=Oryza glaberrima TaxID=4538 RepID=UPI00224C28C2|nr:LEAF RUST 10 DISEASE-RESISTANCE LOCUS RECEPTOR-LIKE PROTEIN KINASE-like 2.1 isoform X2 [Oryza glaberrima]
MAMAGNHRSSQLHLLLLFCCTTTLRAAALSFDYDFSADAAKNLVFMGDAAHAGDRINLTNLGVWRAGRVAHRQLVRLWDDDVGGGRTTTTSFTTAFSFAIGRNSTNQPADGMAFFVGLPRDNLPPHSDGAFFGLLSNNYFGPYGSPRTVGVEFDTFSNPMWDPEGTVDHVGIDVNTVTSKNTTAMPTLSLLAGVMRAEVSYDAAAARMAVTLRTLDGMSYSVEAAVDLRAAGLPQDAAVGFSAATGDLVESHQLLSWSFNSSTDGSVSSTGSPLVSESKKKRIKTYIIASTSSLLGISVLVLAVFLVYKKHKCLLPWQRSTTAPRLHSLLRSQLKSYTYSEVRKMTKSFTHTLGKGGYGTVYKGSLSDGSTIAVKILEDSNNDGEDFINEVSSIGRTSHINVVTLLGLCQHGSKRALIYEYMPNGSLDKFTVGGNDTMQQEKFLISWEKLYDILVGVAQGLDYLHHWCNHRVVYLDIKPQNILLDQDFCPKISDFGLAKLCKPKESKISIGCARGTIGYMAPEVFWGHRGAVTTKSDVYSYGMLILHMVGERENINASTESGSKYFPEWLYDNLNQFCGVPSGGIDGSNSTSEVAHKLVIIGFWCIQSAPMDRPSMSEVIDMFDRSLTELQLPPRISCCGNYNESFG